MPLVTGGISVGPQQTTLGMWERGVATSMGRMNHETPADPRQKSSACLRLAGMDHYFNWDDKWLWHYEIHDGNSTTLTITGDKDDEAIF